jgi:hypothetical protein
MGTVGAAGGEGELGLAARSKIFFYWVSAFGADAQRVGHLPLIYFS